MASGTINTNIQESLSSGTDLNNVTRPGLYYCDGCKNSPTSPSSNQWGFLIVLHASTGNRCKQLYSPNNNATWYTRFTESDGTWNAWVTV